MIRQEFEGAHDPITLSVIYNRLLAINQEMGITMVNTSISPIFAEVHDFSCAICDWDNRIVAQIDGVPSHTASAMEAVKAVSREFGEDIHPGDVFVLNDPYLGGTHLPDVTIMKPIFFEGALQFVGINRAHHGDVGGLEPGSYAPGARELFHEGIRIPPLRIYRDERPIMDVINMISKVPGLPDAPSPAGEGYVYGGQFFCNGPRMLEFFAEMKREVLSKYDILTVGETPGVTTQNAIDITNEETGALNMVFQFEHMGLDAAPGGSSRESIAKWKLADLKKLITRWQKDLEGKGWNSNYLNNHDQPRQVSRFGNDREYRVESAKLLGTFLHMLQGTPYIYQGEELGMTNVAFDSITDYRDIESLNIYHALVDEKGLDPQEVMKLIHAKGRDNARTPMQWDGSAQAGFTSGVPWIKVNPNYPQINAAQALEDPDSIFYYYQELIQLRKTIPAVVYGSYELILPEHAQIYAFTRTLANDRLLVVLNFSTQPADFELPGEIAAGRARLLIANYTVTAKESGRRFTLRPYEARVYHLKVQ